MAAFQGGPGARPMRRDSDVVEAASEREGAGSGEGTGLGRKGQEASQGQASFLPESGFVTLDEERDEKMQIFSRVANPVRHSFLSQEHTYGTDIPQDQICVAPRCR
jgi:hypothetical protein